MGMTRKSLNRGQAPDCPLSLLFPQSLTPACCSSAEAPEVHLLKCVAYEGSSVASPTRRGVGAGAARRRPCVVMHRENEWESSLGRRKLTAIRRRPFRFERRRCKIDRLARLAGCGAIQTHNNILPSSVAESGMPKAVDGASPAAEAGGEADVEAGLQRAQTAGVAAALDASNPLYGHLEAPAGGPLHKTHTWPPSSTSTVRAEQREPLICSPGPNPAGDDIERGMHPQQQVGGPAQDDGSVEQGLLGGQPERAELPRGQPPRPEQALLARRGGRCPCWCPPRCGGVERRALNRQVINQPGEWDFMISYTQKSEASKAIAERLRDVLAPVASKRAPAVGVRPRRSKSSSLSRMYS
eukprot:COSAG02_NODE_1296_length_13393_cov_15.825109_12_plen_355_part_00